MTKVKFIAYFSLLLLLFPLLGKAQSTQTEFELSLEEALKYGLEHSTSIKQAVYDQRKAKYREGEVMSSGLPQISAEAQYQNYPNLPTQILPGELVGQPGQDLEVQFGTEYNANATIKASQLIFDQSFFIGLQAAKGSRELYRLMKESTEEEVLYEVSTAFYTALQLESQLKVLDSNLKTLEQLENLMKVQYENDLVKKTDYSRVKVNKANLNTQFQSLQANYKQQKNYLKLLLGMPISNQISLEKPEELEDISLQSMQYEREEQIEMQILEKQKVLSQLEKKSFSAGYYPTLSLFGQQMWQAQRNEFNFFDNSEPWFQQTLWGIKLQIPIFDGLKKHRQIQQSNIELEKMSLQQTHTERQLDMQFENAREQLNNSLKSVKAQEENKELAKEVYQQTQELYQEQVASLTELLDAEQAYRESQNNYYNELIKFKVAELDLLKAQGKLKTIITQ
ncbi:MAG: hypothetical protein CMC96_12445 [Flavobacteriales bacterium]|nr:hypothetical protein [Flavobacteriales bacterium]|tara:strand:- start:8354 stop:9709 length:1356 start_codon:yes stop_codon:yes gene_type:complete